jgi:integrase
LRVKDVDLLHGELTVAHALKETNGKRLKDADWMTDDERGQRIGSPKSEASRRTFAMPEPIKLMLAEHLARDLPGGNSPDSLVFTTPAGTPVRQSNFYGRHFIPAARKALPERTKAAEARARARGKDASRVSPVRWHDLRHTCASISLSYEPNMMIVKERLGHEDIRTTVNTYGKLLPEADRAHADGLGKLFVSEPAVNVTPIRKADEA